MDIKEAIDQLQDALKIANLPDSLSDEMVVTDADGNITAASIPYRIGYMETCIRYALSALGADPNELVVSWTDTRTSETGTLCTTCGHETTLL